MVQIHQTPHGLLIIGAAGAGVVKLDEIPELIAALQSIKVQSTVSVHLDAHRALASDPAFSATAD